MLQYILNIRIALSMQTILIAWHDIHLLYIYSQRCFSIIFQHQFWMLQSISSWYNGIYFLASLFSFTLHIGEKIHIYKKPETNRNLQLAVWVSIGKDEVNGYCLLQIQNFGLFGKGQKCLKMSSCIVVELFFLFFFFLIGILWVILNNSFALWNFICI